jgi:hypothetical protein
MHMFCIPAHTQGAFRDRHERRVGMRWTRAALLTRALHPRTAKSCGPDAPTLASSWRKRFRRRWWQESPVTRESPKQPLTPSRAGMPGDSGATVVTNARATYSTRAAAGASGTRHSPRPLGGRIHASLGRNASRECEGVFDEYGRATLPAVIARESGRSSIPRRW